MSDSIVRVAIRLDLPRLTEIYNYYVVNTAATFDLEPLRVEGRAPRFDEHSNRGPYRLLVPEEAGRVVGYASTGRFRVKPAHHTTVE
jgi:phosphinothricin acetyltransferase